MTDDVAMATILRQPQQQIVYPSDVIAVPRDVMTTSGRELALLDDSLLQSSFCDVTDTSQLQLDAWMMTSFAADDSGVFLGQSISNDDEWNSGIPPGSHGCDVITEHAATQAAHASGVRNRPCDVIEYVDTKTLGVVPWSCDWSERVASGNTRDVIAESSSHCGSVRFSDEQVACICVALQQQRDIDKLESFLSTLTLGQSGRQPDLACRSQIAQSSRETCDHDVLPVTSRRAQSSDVVDAVLSSAAHVAFRRGRYRELYDVLRSHSFSPGHHGRLQQLWYDAHYAEAAVVRRRLLGAVDKYRIRRKHPLPTTIWDGQDTVYCFKVGRPSSTAWGILINVRDKQRHDHL